jgi:type VI secretion system protein ImpA
MHDMNSTPLTNGVASLLQPISAASLAGGDMTYSTLFDQIREARRADDTGLAQGEWATEVKSSDWRLVCSLCESALQDQTKDLQLAAWYTEAQVHLYGLAGLAGGLDVAAGILLHFWQDCYPSLDDGALDERIGRLEWLNRQVSAALRQVPLTARESGSYNWLHWQQSRAVENLGLRDPKAKAEAIADGKLAGDVFDRAVRDSGVAFYLSLCEQAQRARSALDTLLQVLDDRFGPHAPSMADLGEALDECARLVSRFYGDLTGRAFDPVPNAAQGDAASVSSLPAEAAAHGVGTLNNRSDAIQALRTVASYFRVNEPQSPVALLAERAARWAEMSMDEWLAAVIKDEGTLGQLRELLDIRAGA